MDEEELVPGIDGQTFEIRLGEEFANQGDVILTPQELNEMVQEDLVEAIVNIPVLEGTEEIHRHYVGNVVNQMEAYREAYDRLMEQTATQLQNEIADAFQAQPLGNLNFGADAVVSYHGGDFTYYRPVEVVQPVENIQEVNLGQRTAGHITREHLQEAVNTVYRGGDLTRQNVEEVPTRDVEVDAGHVQFGARVIHRTQRQATPANDWGVAWKDTNEERVRKIEYFREELLKLMEDSDGSEESMKKIKSFIELY